MGELSCKDGLSNKWSLFLVGPKTDFYWRRCDLLSSL